MYQITTLILAAASFAYAQDTSGLPTCAQGCVGNSLSSTGCNLIDAKCICSASGYIESLSCCVGSQCSPDDIQKTLNYARSICAGVGVTNLPDAPSCPSSSAASGQSSMTMSGSGMSTMASETTGAPASASSAAASGGSSASSAAGASTTGGAPRDYIGIMAAGMAGIAGVGAALL